MELTKYCHHCTLLLKNIAWLWHVTYIGWSGVYYLLHRLPLCSLSWCARSVFEEIKSDRRSTWQSKRMTFHSQRICISPAGCIASIFPHRWSAPLCAYWVMPNDFVVLLCMVESVGYINWYWTRSFELYDHGYTLNWLIYFNVQRINTHKVVLLCPITSGVKKFLFYSFLNRLYSFFTQFCVVFTCWRLELATQN